MSRSPLAYPLNRSADMDAGGAADLQTDIMRFMAILSLCLVAIFALVQSIPLTPVQPPVPIEPEPVMAPEPEPIETNPVIPESAAPAAPEPAARDTVLATKKTVAEETPSVALRRPKWVPKFQPAEPEPRELTAVPESAPRPEAPPPTEPRGFVLRFESDAALMRAVAASHVGLYAIAGGAAQRMTVSNSRVSFWAASTPNTFHEMEATTVPPVVVEALARTGTSNDSVSWGVTLPGTLKTRLDTLMQAHSGGSLIIGASGNIRWEAS